MVLVVGGMAVGLMVAHGEEGSFLYDSSSKRISADVEGLNLSELLQLISDSTSWQIFVEPKTQLVASSKFTELPADEGLSRILGDLNYALLIEPTGSAKLYVYQTTIGSATERIDPRQRTTPDREAESRVPNELVVTLGPGQTGIEALAERLGGKVTGHLPEINAYRVEFPDEETAQRARAALGQESDVARVDYNHTVPQPDQPSPLAYASSLPPKLKLAPVSEEDRLIVGLIDTPVQGESVAFAELLLPSIRLAGDVAPSTGQLSHGTAMAETILHGLTLANDQAGWAMPILPVDVYGNQSSTTTFDIARGISAAVEGGARIINLSLGGHGGSPFIHDLIRRYHEQEVLFIAAAGNEPTADPYYPAAYPETLAVTAGDRYGQLAAYANRGEFVDVIAPGASVVHYEERAYLGSGTSFSTAYVTGLAAYLHMQTGKPLPEVEQEIRRRMAFRATE